MTLTNLPNFVTHNKLSSDFTIPKTNDLSLIGSYVVTIKSEICVPKDYTKVTCSLMFDQYQFTVFVEPCLVSFYTSTLKVDDIFYKIGTTALKNVSPYTFDESPVCNYPEKVTLTNLPTFVTHNAPTTADFSVPFNSNISLIGSFTITIRSEINFPTDYTKKTLKSMFVEYSFIVFIEPNLVTEVCASYGDIQKISYALPETLTNYEFSFTNNRE